MEAAWWRPCHNEAVQLWQGCLGGITGDQGTPVKEEHLALDSQLVGVSSPLLGATADKHQAQFSISMRAFCECALVQCVESVFVRQ